MKKDEFTKEEISCYEKCRNAINDFMRTRNEFTILQLTSWLKSSRKDITFRAGPDVTIEEHLKNLVKIKVLKYDQKTDKYSRVEKICGYEILKRTVAEFITDKKEFALYKLADEIKKRGGVLRAGPNYTLKEYLENFIHEGILKENPGTDVYTVNVDVLAK